MQRLKPSRCGGFERPYGFRGLKGSWKIFYKKEKKTRERIEIENELSKTMKLSQLNGWSSAWRYEDLWILVEEGRTLIQIGNEERMVFNGNLSVSTEIAIGNAEHLVWVSIRFSFYNFESGPDLVYESRLEKKNRILDAYELYDAAWNFIDIGESFRGNEGYSPLLKKAIEKAADDVLLYVHEGVTKESLLDDIYEGDPSRHEIFGVIWGSYVIEEA